MIRIRISNYADVDDDGDSYGTKIEINNPATGLSYPFADIPSCDSNTTDAARVKKHLDKVVTNRICCQIKIPFAMRMGFL
jgi:hypothetical protein